MTLLNKFILLYKHTINNIYLINLKLFLLKYHKFIHATLSLTKLHPLLYNLLIYLILENLLSHLATSPFLQYVIIILYSILLIKKNTLMDFLDLSLTILI